MKVGRSIGIVLGLLLTWNCQAQQVQLELQKLKENYLKAKAFSMNVLVSVYPKTNVDAGSMKFKGSVSKSKNMYFSDMMNVITLMNNDCFLMVDKQQKRIYYGKPGKQKPAGGAADIHEMLDSSVVDHKNVKLLANAGGLMKIELPMRDKSMYNKMQMTLNTQKHTLVEVVYFYSKEQDEVDYDRVAISYSDVKFNEDVPVSSFSSANYISKKGKTILPSSAWAGYKIVDQSDVEIDEKMLTY